MDALPRRPLTGNALYLIINRLKRHLAAIFSYVKSRQHLDLVKNKIQQDSKRASWPVDCFRSRVRLVWIFNVFNDIFKDNIQS